MIVYIISILLIGLTIYLLMDLICDWQKSMKTGNSLVKREKRVLESIFLKYLLPLLVYLAPLVNRIKLNGYKRYIQSKLIGAGLDHKLMADEFMAYQILMAALFILGELLLLLRFSFIASLLSAALGGLFPLLWLYSIRKEREKEVLLALPYIIDLLTLSVEAGLDFISAVGRIVERGNRSPLTEELRRMLGQIRLGKNRSDALEEVKMRLSIPSVDAFVSMLVQAQKLGASIGPVLKAHATKLRSDRFQRAEKAGIQAAQKLLIPLVFFIMPAVFFIIFGPILVMWKTGIFERMFY